MSSTYRVLCLNHDPALVVGDDWRSPEAALAAVDDRSEQLPEHVGCDLLVGRFSYPLVEVGCPRTMGAPHLHSVPIWVDACWLRVALAAVDQPDPTGDVTEALRRLGSCWSAERLRRLRPHLF